MVFAGARERVLPLEGGRNFRDIGGYAAADGRRVRWGLLYRAGGLNGLTLADFDYLRGLGIKTVCDLRSVEERLGAPTQWLGDDAPEILAVDYEMNAIMARVQEALGASGTAENARAGFAAMYADLPVLLETHYREMFQRLVRGEAPLAFHCSAGKDRTGMAAALILSVLGVPRHTILEDYELSDRYFTQPALQTAREGVSIGDTGVESAASAEQILQAEVFRVLMGADPAVLAGALTRIDAEHGGPMQLARTRYGLTDDAIAALRNQFLE